MIERVTAEDEDQYGGAEAPRMEGGYGHIVMNGTTKLVSWILGIFGAVMTILLSLVLSAVYNLNGDLHEMKGEGIVDADLADTVCPILAKSVWTPQERETLWNAILSLWPHETY